MLFTSSDSVSSRVGGRRRVNGCLSAGVLLFILGQLSSLPACKRSPCDPAVALKTPALYLEHAGDEDKPIATIVLGTARPTDSECKCATPTRYFVAYRHMYTVTNEEFSNVARIVDSFKDASPPAGRGEYRYVLVRGPGIAQIGRLDRDQSKSLFAALQTYFKERKPEVYTALSETNRMF